LIHSLESEPFNAFDYYGQGRDWAYKDMFAFYNVPRGTYCLGIEAKGYAPYSRQCTICPGQSRLSSEFEIYLTELPVR
jgi:hypothetical protein